ncbi:pectate lyase [Cellulophaga phage phi19:3]|uniref:Structural protein n=1 Tax=Cellulophaga phage phi19:3 TaxID=1327971 RepID=R9ZYZ5_9CAUD|nr:pectate lyase [Cellulophaga phage phi19:3]AGO47492.1 structural protein [Cellulophaga phage phi19:3]
MKKTIYILSILLLTISGVSAQTVIKIKQPNPQQITIADDSIKLNGSTSVPLSDIIKPITLAEYNAMDAATKLKNAGRQIIDPTGVPTAISIVDGSVSTAKIANSAVSGIKILDEAITESKIADASITDTKINADTYKKLYYAVPDGYISPRDYGAVMDGITDDRIAFVNTLTAANTLGKRIWIDSDINLDVEETGTKSIFIPSNTWIEGRDKDVRILINNLLSPAFYIALQENVTFKNITFSYDNTYDATIRYTDASTLANDNQIKNYLTANKSVNFNGLEPIKLSPVNYRYGFRLDGSKNVVFENVVFDAEGDLANAYPLGWIKLIEQYSESTSVVSGGATTVCENITFKNIDFNKSIMGIQGLVQGFYMSDVKSYYFTDCQDGDGSNLGGEHAGSTAYWMPPPHLIYLNNDGSVNHQSKDIHINNVIDYGFLVGTTAVRADGRDNQGYLTSLKTVNNMSNVYVDGYKSYRRDGLADIGDITNGVYKNMYSESTTDIFESSRQFTPLRFVGIMDDVLFDNIVIKDLSDIASTYPISRSYGDNVTMNNIQLFSKTLSTTYTGVIGVSGSNNTIKNLTYTIENHTDAASNYQGLIFHDNTTMDSGYNNNYEITVNGWRNINSDPIALKPRMLFSKAINPNNNYARLYDSSNNNIIEQINEFQTDTWTKTEVVTLSSGVQQTLTMNIPSGYAINKVIAVTQTSLDAGTTVSIGTVSGTANNLIPLVVQASGTGSIAINNINETSLSTSARSIYIRTSTGDFNSTGKVKVTVELKRWRLN